MSEKFRPDAGKPPQSEKTPKNAPEKASENGARPPPDPTRYNDWEKGGRCIDF